MIFFYASWYVSWVLSSPTWRNMTYQLLQQTMRDKLIIGSYFQVSGLPRLPPAFSSMRFGKCFDINLILCTAAQPIQFVHVIHLQDRLQVFLEILQIKYCMLPNSLCIGIQINIPKVKDQALLAWNHDFGHWVSRTGHHVSVVGKAVHALPILLPAWKGPMHVPLGKPTDR